MRTYPSGTGSSNINDVIKANYNRPKNEGRRYGLIIRNEADYRPSVAHDETALWCTAYGTRETREHALPEQKTILSSCEVDDKH